MAVSEDGVSKILSIISHPLRREILSFIHEKGECSFTDLLNKLQVDTGKLSFHLRTLSAFTKQTSAGKYKLSKTGEKALRIIRDVESWAEGADVGAKAALLPYASFAKRAYAFLFDASLMIGVTLVFALPIEILPPWLGGGLNLGAILIIALGLLFVYSTLLEGFNGQTLGKRVIGLKVVRVDGKELGYEHSAVRNFGKTFLLPVDLLIELQHEKSLRYFDKFAGTTVIDLRGPPEQLPVKAAEASERELEIASQPSESQNAS